jgi:predicted metal-dependent phosphoesterase TrpH
MRRPAPRRARERVDLHLHSIFSDGTLTPEELVAQALALQLAAIALTDHDSLEGLARARTRAAGQPIEVVPALELSTATDGANVHVLGYFVDPSHEGLRGRLVELRAERRERARLMVEKLGALGVAIDLEAVYALAGPGAVGRPHVAEALVRAGLVRDPDEAFRRYVGHHAPAFVPRAPFSPAQGIGLVIAAGGVAVLAHPGSLRRDDLIPAMIGAGLRGIEVWHPNHDPQAVRRYLEIAERHGLLTTGGSDYHGPQRGDEMGEQPVPLRSLEALKAAAGVSG